jgi:hypothetical protein
MTLPNKLTVLRGFARPILANVCILGPQGLCTGYSLPPQYLRPGTDQIGLTAPDLRVRVNGQTIPMTTSKSSGVAADFQLEKALQ